MSELDDVLAALTAVFVEAGVRATPFVLATSTARAEQRPLVLATVAAGGPLGARLKVHEGGRRQGSLGDDALDDEVARLALDALAGAHSHTITACGGVRMFLEVAVPPIRLVLCAARHDAVPLVEFGARLGWRVEVADDPPALLVRERFPQASRFVRTQPGRSAGLDVGAEGPEEIAWAIVAEILAVRSGLPEGPLRDRPGPIHAARTTVGATA